VSLVHKNEANNFNDTVRHFRFQDCTSSHSRMLFILCTSLFFIFIGQKINADILPVPNDHETVQDAIDESSQGDTVLLATGEYEEGVIIRLHGLTIASEYILDEDTSVIEETILLGAHDLRPITIRPGTVGAVIIFGLTITEGNLPDSIGGGIRADGIEDQLVEIHLIRNIIRDNAARSYGAAYLQYCDGSVRYNRFEDNAANTVGALGVSYSTMIIEYNSFINNESNNISGAINIFGASTVIRRNLFEGNTARSTGGAIRIYYLDSIMEDNIFLQNSGGFGGALSCSFMDSLIIRRNLFSGNRAFDVVHRRGVGGAAVIGPEMEYTEISDNSFIENEAERGGGALQMKDNGIIYNNVFIRNRSTFAGAIYGTRANNREPFVTIHDNLFVANTNYIGLEADTMYYGALTSLEDATFDVYDNDFIGNNPIAAGYSRREGNMGVIEAENNFWGDESGPFHEEQNPDGLGDTVDTRLDIIPFSAERYTEFEPPEEFDLVSPADTDTNDTMPIVFRWDAAADPNEDDEIRYTLEYSLFEDFEQSTLVPAGTETFVDAAILGLETLYYWRVYAEDDMWLRSYSTEVRNLFVTGDGFAPEPFSLGSPADEDTNEFFHVQFTWYPAIDPNEGDIVRYWFEIARNYEFVDSSIYFTNTDTFISISEFPRYESDYVWKVYAEDNLGLRTYSNEVHRVFITNEGFPPEPFDLGTPADSSIIENDSILFTWNQSVDYTIDDEVSYVLVITPEDDLEHPRSFRTNQDTFRTINDLDLENVYRWHVYAQDIAGHTTNSNQSHVLFYGNNVAAKQFEGIPTTWELSAVYPNPFNPVVRVVVGVPKSGIVKAEIYDILGRSVAVLIDDKLNPGYHHLSWWAQGSSGVYFLRISSDSGWNTTRKLLYVR